MTTIASPLSYAAAGVDYSQVDAIKVAAQESARGTALNAAATGMRELAASRGESAYVFEVNGVLLATITECLGTKALVADEMRSISKRSHYDAIAQDTVAAALNDLVSVGATPMSVHAYWAAGDSAWYSDSERTSDLIRGWTSSCTACGAVWGGGETPALAGLLMPGRIDLAASCVGIIKSRDRLTLGENLAPGDAIVMLSSSGIHANGVSLARKIAEGLPHGYGTRLPSGRWYGESLLDPTVLYAPILEAIAAAGLRPKYSVNITGHGWRKLMRHPASFSYIIDSVPHVPEVLSFMVEQAHLTPHGAYGSLNMGAGFALFVDAARAEETVRCAVKAGCQAWIAGHIELGPKRVLIKPIDVVFESDELQLRDR